MRKLPSQENVPKEEELTGFIVPERDEKVTSKHFVQVDAVKAYSDKLLSRE